MKPFKTIIKESSKARDNRQTQLHHSLKKHFHKNIEPNMSVNHTWAVQHYTNTGYKYINRSLYNATYEKESDISEAIPHLDSAFTRHQTTKPMIVYSGVKRSPEHELKLGQRKFSLPAYTSTSLHMFRARSFASGDPASEHTYAKNATYSIKDTPDPTITKMPKNFIFNSPADDQTAAIKAGHPEPKTGYVNVERYRHVMAIHVPKGTHGLYVDPISANMGEREFTLPRSGAKMDDGHTIHSHLHVHPVPLVNHHERTVIWRAKLRQKKVKSENAE